MIGGETLIVMRLFVKVLNYSMENYIYKIYIGYYRNYAKYEIDFGKCVSRSRRGNVWEDWEPMIAKELDFFSAIEPEILEYRNKLFHKYLSV